MSERPAYQPKTAAELEQLAQDVWAGRVFTSMHAPPEMLRSIFIILAFMEREDLEALQKDEITLLYEHIEKAETHSVNGYPAFMSVKLLNKPDHERLIVRLREIEAFFKGRDGAVPVTEGAAT